MRIFISKNILSRPGEYPGRTPRSGRSAGLFPLCAINRSILIFSLLAAFFFLLTNPTAVRADLFLEAENGTVDFGYVYASDLMNGFKELGASTLDYAERFTVTDTGTAGWELTARAESPVFISPHGSKPCSDLEWRLNDTGNYSPLTTSASVVATGSGDETIELDYRIKTGWDDTPGAYNLTVVYTLSEAI